MQAQLIQIQIIVMHQRTLTVFTQLFAGFCRVGSNASYTDRLPFGIHYFYDVILLKVAYDAFYPDGQYTHRLVAPDNLCGMLVPVPPPG